MKKQDIILIACVVIVLAPFFIPATGFLAGFEYLTAHYPYVMAFFKFAILSTLGEMIGLRICKGVYNEKGFGIVPRMMVWGFLGMLIAAAMTIFKTGVPVVIATIGNLNPQDVTAIFKSSDLTIAKVGIAFAISVMMNTIFAPVMMTFHKCTDTHILQNGGTVKGLLKPLKMRQILPNLDWDKQWNFVFKKTIPLFWFPAHTITFLLPGTWQVLFAAFLGVALGVILAFANNSKKN